MGGVLGGLINAYPNLTLLNYSVKEQLKDILPSLLIAIAMGAIVFSIRLLELSDMATMCLQIFTGIAIYIALAKIFRLECFSYLVMSLKEIFKKNKIAPTEEIYQ